MSGTGGRGPSHRGWRAGRVRSAAALFPGGVLAVHELRYLLAFGARAGHQLSARGDSYVGTASGLAGLLLLLAAAGLLGALARARSGQADGGANGLGPWRSLIAWTVLLTLGFVAVEAIEMVFESAHPAGLNGILGSGGWWALPASAIVAGLFTLLRRGARALVRRASRRRGRGRNPDVAARPSARQSQRSRRPRRTPLGGRAAGRAPPAAASRRASLSA